MDNLLLSCCYGMGIGTARSLKTALPYCVRAALSGDIPALLTSLTLFDICQQTCTQEIKRLEDESKLPLSVQISRWKTGNWGQIQPRYELPSEGEIVPSIFSSTPAARKLCNTYSTIRRKLALMICSVCGSSDGIDQDKGRGWELLHNLMEHVETMRIEYEFGTIGTVCLLVLYLTRQETMISYVRRFLLQIPMGIQFFIMQRQAFAGINWN
jgi:hypothetical protein